MVEVAYERWSFIRSSHLRALTGKIVVNLVK